jgi:RimJ/RimL family protein N-acetyltransferase
VQRAAPAEGPSAPPRVLDACRRLLEDALGPLELLPGSGPSYLIHDRVEFPASAPLVCSDDAAASTLADANPGNWEPDEWQQLLSGRLGAWAMATRHDQVIAICHTPVSSPRAAEAGVWTRPEFRGHGHAAAVTAAWAALLRRSGRVLFYSAAGTNLSSQRVAARLGLRELGWLWQLARAVP